MSTRGAVRTNREGAVVPEVDQQQASLFTVTTTPVTTPKRTPTSNVKPKWMKYRPINPVKCDDCMLVLFMAKGEAPASKQARWRRKQGEGDLLLCYGHAEVRRAEDGLRPLKDWD